MGFLFHDKYSLFLPFLTFVLYILTTNGRSKDKVLLIGILSAPDNFELRESIRNSWLQDPGNDVEYYFLIGKYMCEIPWEDRIDEQSCLELPVYVPEENENQLLLSGAFSCFDDSDITLMFGYSFTVQFDIIIKQIGIIKKLCEKNIKVILVEAATGQKITSATFLCNSSSNSILWQNIENYKLPKGFEGRIIWEASTKKSVKTSCGFNWHSAGNIFAYHMFWKLNGLPVEYDNKSLTPITIGYEIPGLQDLRDFQAEKQSRVQKWKSQIKSLKEKIDNESKRAGDILYLDVVDVYRSLAKKMLEFYKWANTNVNFSFLLKTDDDTYINLTTVKKELYYLSQQDNQLPSRLWWWSDFREGWMVQWSGKWREASYRSLSYPPFPCGAGYVLSKGIVSFLSSIAEKLCIQYQGEDVALGIWLSSTNPPRVETNRFCSWVCNRYTTGDQNCNYPQLSPKEMKFVHQRKQEYDNKLNH